VNQLEQLVGLNAMADAIVANVHEEAGKKKIVLEEVKEDASHLERSDPELLSMNDALAQ